MARSFRLSAATDAILEVMRELDLFQETSLGKYLGMILENKLRNHFDPEPIEKPRIEPKSKAERVIEEGLFLLQHKGPHAAIIECGRCKSPRGTWAALRDLARKPRANGIKL